MPVVLSDNLAFPFNDGKGILAAQLDGFTVGTADPTGGKNDDWHFQVDGSDNLTSIWRNVAGTWTEYILPASGSGGFTLRTGSAAPAASLGDSGDWYLRTSNGQWYEKVNTTWHGRFAPPQLSDADPLATSTSADPGSGLASSRDDHIHVGLALGNQEAEDTGSAAETGTRGFASREDHVHAVGFGTGNVEPVGTANAAGTNEHPARRDHVHMGDGAGSGTPTPLSDADPEDVGTVADPGTDSAASRSDHVHIGDGSGGGGGGTDDQIAVEVLTSVNDFDGLLSSSDIDVQAALDTLDETERRGHSCRCHGGLRLATWKPRTDIDVQTVAGQRWTT